MTIFAPGGTHGINGIVLPSPVYSSPIVLQAGFATQFVNATSGSYQIENYGWISNGVSLAGGGLITNGSSGSIGGGGIVIGAAALITNAGTVTNNISVRSGGLLTNSGTIGGTVSIGSAGSVFNSGGIAGSVTFAAGGLVSNASSGSINGIYITGGAGTVVNAGGITDPVYLFDGGRVTNPAGATIFGVWIRGGTGTFSNAGSIVESVDLSSGGTAINSGAIGGGMELTGSGAVTNASGGSVQGGISVLGVAGTLVNQGGVPGPVFLDTGGLVSNASGGSIGGGIAITGGVGTVENSHLITYTIYLGAGGSVINASSGSIDCAIDGAISIAGGAGTIANSGSITGSVYLGAGGSISNASSGSIVGVVSIANSSGTVVNAGYMNASFDQAAGGSVSNTSSGTITDATLLSATGSLINSGLINSFYTAVGGSVTNTTSGRIAGARLGSLPWTLVNDGTVNGVTFSAAGGSSLINNGMLYGLGTLNAVTTNNGTLAAASLDTPTAGVASLIMSGPVTGTGVVEIRNQAALEVSGAVAQGQTVSFDSSNGSLILDQLSSFAGTITGLTVGDQIELKNVTSGAVNGANGGAVTSATIGTLSGTPTLNIHQIDNGDSIVSNIPLAVAASQSLAGDYFKVSQDAAGTDTILTLAQGNPVDLAVNGPAARQTYNVTGAGIKVGIVSDSFNALGGESADIASGALPSTVKILSDLPGTLVAKALNFIGGDYPQASDEGRAMAQIVHDIAPGAAIDFAAGVANYPGLISGAAVDSVDDQLASAIAALQADGCNIIVDDVGITDKNDLPAEPNAGSATEKAIDTAVAAGVTYITAAGNDRPTAVYGHSLDANALTVASMNLLATPTPASAVGGYLATQTESDSSIGAAGTGKPNITGPDGVATTLDEASGLAPFFGTSAAAPAVAAVAALMMQKNPALKTQPLVVDNLLETSAEQFPDASVAAGSKLAEGSGLVQADKAVAAASSAPGGDAAAITALYKAILRATPSPATLTQVEAQITAGTITLAGYQASLISGEQAIWSTLPALVTIDADYNATPQSAVLDSVASSTGTPAQIGGFYSATYLHNLGYSDANVWTILASQWGADQTSAFYKQYNTFGANYGGFISSVYQREFGSAPSAANLQILVNDVPGVAKLLGGGGGAASSIQVESGIYGYLLYVGQTTPGLANQYSAAAVKFLQAAAASTVSYGPELTVQFPPAGAAAADPGVITISGANQLVDPGSGGQTIQFITGSRGDVVLYADGEDQISGFDPFSDVLDLRSLLSAANVNVSGGIAALGNYVTITDQGGDALVNFDPSGHGGGSTIAVLTGLGNRMIGLNILIQDGALRIG